MENIIINASLDDYARKIEELSSKLKELDRNTEEYAQTQKELESATEHLNNATGDLDTSLASATDKIGYTSDSIKTMDTALQAGIGAFGKTGMAVAKFGGSMGIATGSLKTFVKGWNALKVALASNPFGLIITSVVALGATIVSHLKSVKDAEEEYKRLKASLLDISGAMNEYVAKDQTRAEILYNAAIRAKEGTQERTNAIIALQREFPAYFANLNAENAKNTDLAASYRALSQDIERAATARAAYEKLVEIKKTQLDLDVQIQDLRERGRQTYNNRYNQLIAQGKSTIEAAKGAKELYVKMATGLAKVTVAMTDGTKQEMTYNEVLKYNNTLREAANNLSEKVQKNQGAENKLKGTDIKITTGNTAATKAYTAATKAHTAATRTHTAATKAHTAVVNKHNSSLEKQAKLSAEIEAKYKALYRVYDLMINESEAFAGDERTKELEKYIITQQKLESELDEIQEKFDKGLISATEFNLLTRENAVAWGQAKKEYDKFIKEFKGEAVKGSSLTDIYKVPADVGEQIQDNITNRLDEAAAAAYKLQKAFDSVTTADIFANPKESLAALKDIQDQAIEAGEELPKGFNAKKNLAGTLATLGSLSSLAMTVGDAWKSMAEMQVAAGEMTQEQAEEQFEKFKSMEVAAATVNTIAGAVGAFMKAKETYPTPWGAILGSIEAASTLAAGYMQINQIKQQKIGSTSTASGPTIITGAATPLLNEAQDVNQLNAMNAATEQTDTRVYVLESDISDAQNRQKVRVNEATF